MRPEGFRVRIFNRVQTVFGWLDHREAPFVQLAAEAATRRPFSAVLRAINKLYDGWIYLVLIAVLAGARNWRLLIVGILSGSAASALFSSIKPRFRRVRPCDQHDALVARGRYLDEFSFPSGHCMTFAATGVPIGYEYHSLIPLLAVVFLLLGWGRMAAAHHYASDVVLGAMTGTAIALPLSIYMLA